MLEHSSIFYAGLIFSPSLAPSFHHYIGTRQLLTDYENLQNVVPNLVVNEVLEILPGSTNDTQPVLSTQSRILSDAEQCREIANKMKGAVLKQVGGAKVVGINFSAKTTLEVREWPNVSNVFFHTHTII